MRTVVNNFMTVAWLHFDCLFVCLLLCVFLCVLWQFVVTGYLGSSRGPSLEPAMSGYKAILAIFLLYT